MYQCGCLKPLIGNLILLKPYFCFISLSFPHYIGVNGAIHFILSRVIHGYSAQFLCQRWLGFGFSAGTWTRLVHLNLLYWFFVVSFSYLKLKHYTRFICSYYGPDLLVDGLKAFRKGSPNMNSLVGFGSIAAFAISAVRI